MDRTVLRNAVVNVGAEAVWGFQGAMVASATVLTLVLREYGAGTQMISSIMAIETIGLILPQIIGVYLFRRFSGRKVPLVVWHFLTVIPLMFLMAGILAMAPRMSAVITRWLVLGTYAVFMCSIGVVLSVWMDWLAGLFETRIRGTVTGVSFGAAALTGILGSLFSGWMLHRHTGTQSYPWLYLLAAVVGVLAMVLFLLIREKRAVDGVRDDLTTAKIITSVRMSFSDANFIRFLVGRIIAAAGFSVMPFITLYYTSQAGGGLSNDAVVSISAALTAGMFVGNVGFGRLGDLLGHRMGLLLAAGLQVITLAILLATQGPVSCGVAFFFAGICASGGFIPYYNMLFETCPHDARVVHITAGNAVFSLGSAAFPLIGGVVAARLGISALFGASLIVSVLAVGWYLFLVKDPRVEMKRQPSKAALRPGE